jgi:hypothetical protein
VIPKEETLKRVRAQAREYANNVLASLPELPTEVLDVVRDAIGVAYLRCADDGFAYVTFFECRHGMENEVRCVNCEEMEAVNG